MKKVILGLVASMVLAVALYAADTQKVTRLGQNQILNVGGTSTTNGKTVVTSESPTNEFKIVQITATVSGGATASTNTFATAFLATPTVVAGVKSGSSVAGVSSGVTATPSTTTLIVTGLNSAGSTNNLPFIVYGYTRAGIFE